MPGWTSRALGYSKKALLVLIVLLLLWLVYRSASRMIAKAMGATPPAAEAKSAPPTEFKAEDTIQFTAAPGTLQTVESDRTLDAIVRGQFGPAVVLFYADWCTHCKNIQEAYESAAKQAGIHGVVFAKAQGHTVPVCMGRYEIRGYPTVLGIVPGQAPKRFMGSRTSEALVEFAKGLSLQPSLQPPVAPTLALPAAVIEAVPPTVQVT